MHIFLHRLAYIYYTKPFKIFKSLSLNEVIPLSTKLSCFKKSVKNKNSGYLSFTHRINKHNI